jgi:hypothetical protein
METKFSYSFINVSIQICGRHFYLLKEGKVYVRHGKNPKNKPSYLTSATANASYKKERV